MLSMRLASVVAALLLSVATAPAETVRLQTLHFVGSHRFAEQDLSAASGLKAGSNIVVADLQRAADKLMQTGALATVQYKYTPVSTGILVEYQVKDADDFLPCRYDNIVWMNSEAILAEVRRKVPLFNGEAPSSGELVDQVAAALSEVLAAHGIPTTVRYELHSRGVNAPVDAVLFVSETIKPKVEQLSLSGVTQLSPEEVRDNTKRLLGEDYSASAVHESLRSGLSVVYGNKGYLRMQVDTPQVRLLGDPQQAKLAVTANVVEGEQFRIKEILWTGDSAIPTAEVDKSQHLRAGDVADRSKLDFELEIARRAFRKRGYLAAGVQPAAAFHDDRTVTFEIKAIQGDLYHMGSVQFAGLNPSLIEKLQKNWKLKTGEAFDGDYTLEFLKQNASQINAGGRAPQVKMSQTLTPDKVVNVTVEFK
jgi:outer membrane protein assembly factor BamA